MGSSSGGSQHRAGAFPDPPRTFWVNVPARGCPGFAHRRYILKQFKAFSFKSWPGVLKVLQSAGFLPVPQSLKVFARLQSNKRKRRRHERAGRSLRSLKSSGCVQPGYLAAQIVFTAVLVILVCCFLVHLDKGKE